ncbi:MAG TPA: hypothetical protein VFS19_06245 [Planctomycetota bacterium]|nr:hypothetical protein [Planctomycetota bacterium]
MLRLLIATAVLLQEPAGEKFDIRVRPNEGDRIEITDSWTNTFRGRLGDEPLNTASRGGRRLVVQMAKVEKGSLSRKVVEVADSYLEILDVKTSKYIRQDLPLHGRTVTIERKDGAEHRTGVDGVPEAEQKTLALEDPLTRLFPPNPVRIGDTWEISGEGLKQIFTSGDFTGGKITAVLSDVKDVGGRKCAFIRTSYDVNGKSPDGSTRKLNLSGTLTVWIDRGYVLSMSQSGRLTTADADPKTMQPNGEAAVTGELKATLLEK